MEKSIIYVITLNWNGYSDTSELLDSLNQIKIPKIKIIVVDNNSSGNDVELLENNYRDYIHLLKSNSNLGFAGGNNIGIKKALEYNPDYILLINNDTIVEPDFLSILLDKFNVDKKIGIVAPQINYYDEPKKVWSAGGKISKFRGSGFAISNKLENEITQTDRYVNFVSGCCMLIKKEVFQNVGVFDEKFFLYTEDTDFCYRVIKFGYKINLSPKAKIFHKVHTSSRANFASLPLYYTTRNRLYFSKKHFVQYYPLTFVYISSTMLIKSMYWLLVGKIKNISVVLRAFHDFLAGNMGMTKHDFSVKYFF